MLSAMQTCTGIWQCWSSGSDSLRILHGIDWYVMVNVDVVIGFKFLHKLDGVILCSFWWFQWWDPHNTNDYWSTWCGSSPVDAGKTSKLLPICTCGDIRTIQFHGLEEVI